MGKYTIEPHLYKGKFNVILNETAEVVASFEKYEQAIQYCKENNKDIIVVKED